MKKSLFSLLALSLLSLIGSTYAATSGTDSVPLNDPSVVTVTTQTSLTSEAPITDVSVSNVVSQDGVAVAESTTSIPVASPDAISAPVVDTPQVQQAQAIELMARGTTQEMPVEMQGFIGLMFIFPILMFVFGILFSIFWLWMLIDAIKNETEQKALWIIVLFITNGLGAILYYFMVKKPRDKVLLVSGVSSQVVSSSETSVVASEVAVVNPEPVVAPVETPEVVVVNPEPVVVPVEAPVEVPAVDSSAPVADQPSTPVS